MAADGDNLLTVKNFIDGQFVPCKKHLESFEPGTGQVWALIPDSEAPEVDLAVRAARKAFDSWSATSAEQRSKILFHIANIIEANLQEFADLESRDQGKPLWLAKTVDIPRAVHNFRFFASYILHDLNRSRIHELTGAVQYTVKEPMGVAGLISPWNLPLYLLTFKIAPALAAGNTVVVKPSELTSVTAYRLCQVFQEAGVPAGVVNVVFGTGSTAGSSIVTHPDVPLISFTGGTVTAEKIRIAATAHCKKFSLELGGKNAAIIFNDADLDKCVSTTIRSSFLNQGEICLCTSRIFVQSQLYSTFLQRFVAETKKLKVGDRMDPEVFMGALISKDHLDKIQSAVNQAKTAGATIHCQEGDVTKNLSPHLQKGYFVYPAVITDVADDSPTMQEEMFGPITCVVPFETEEEVVFRANNVKYGLCAVIWSKDVSLVHRVSRKLKVGTVWANCWLVRDLNLPFGGCKQSGTGREGGQDSIQFFTEEKTICVQL